MKTDKIGFWALAILASVCCVSWGQGLSDKAKGEVQRRAALGLVVEHVDDQVHDDGTAQLSAAAELPDKDDDKFILNIVVTTDCQPCELLKRDLEKAPELSKWVKLERVKQAGGRELLQSAADSWMHVTFEPLRDPLRPKRFDGLKIDAFPTLIVKPPLDGRYGPPAKVVRQLAGYNGKPADLDAWFAKVISEHIARFQPVRSFPAADIGQRPNPYGPLPYPVPDLRPAGPLPIDMPGPVAPRPLTAAEVKQAAPDASTDFLFEQLAAGVTSADQVRSAWLTRQLKDLKQPDAKPVADVAEKLSELRDRLQELKDRPALRIVEKVATPYVPAWLLALVGILAASPIFWDLVKLGIGQLRLRASSTPSPIDDRLVDILDRLADRGADNAKKEPAA